jgi:TPP-dependent indolepyruvate ferredoxin oxidoreductase alpha subunit
MNNAANKITGANRHPSSQFETHGLRRRALVVESHGRYHGGAAVAQFCRYALEGIADATFN